jgi:RNA-directed DNA polymerase
MSILKKLKETTSLSDIALLLGYKPKFLSYILYKIPPDEKYTIFTIPKKNGDERTIKAPIQKLKKLQRRLANVLISCYDETAIKSPKGAFTKSVAHGFRTKHSIVTNAKKHKNKRYVFNIDLKDFFPSFNFGRVRGFFIKNNQFELDANVATVIAQIACHENELPQGSPCSPIISNLLGHLLDIRMLGLAKRAKCTYTRYADDLTFSTNEKEFPKRIALKNEENIKAWSPSQILIQEIERAGFKINKEKTSMQFKTSRQVATGLIVNKKVNIKKEYFKKARAMCHSLFQTDEFYIGKILPDNNEKTESKENGNDGKKETDSKIPGSLNQLRGILTFIYYVKRPHDQRKIGDRRFKPDGVTKLYREFLFYKLFFALEKPLIICEGKTDNVYLKCAIRQLKNDYKDLIEEKDGKHHLKVRFLNLTKNFKDVCAISEGTPGLKMLMDIYRTYMKPFKGKGTKFPVIILVDNDKGTKKINSLLNKTDFSEPFSYFLENLYAVHIAKEKTTKDIAIEDLFDKKILETKLSGKNFNYKKKKIDPNTEYAKHVFAETVIKPNQNKIDFGGFRDVLEKFQAVIDDYKKKNIEKEKAVKTTIKP